MQAQIADCSGSRVWHT